MTDTGTVRATMTAVAQDRYGEADVLRVDRAPRPVAGPGEVLLRVHAAGVDRGVWHLMTGLPYAVRLAGYGIRAPKDRVRGREVAGRVEAVGPGVTGFAPGDEVYGVGEGTFAEYARARADRIVGGETDGKWFGGIGRSLRAPLYSLVVRPTMAAVMNSENAADLRALGAMIESGAVVPAVDRTFPLREAAAAVRYLVDGHVRGKVVVEIG